MKMLRWWWANSGEGGGKSTLEMTWVLRQQLETRGLSVGERFFPQKGFIQWEEKRMPGQTANFPGKIQILTTISKKIWTFWQNVDNPLVCQYFDKMLTTPLFANILTKFWQPPCLSTFDKMLTTPLFVNILTKCWQPPCLSTFWQNVDNPLVCQHFDKMSTTPLFVNILTKCWQPPCLSTFWQNVDKQGGYLRDSQILIVNYSRRGSLGESKTKQRNEQNKHPNKQTNKQTKTGSTGETELMRKGGQCGQASPSPIICECPSPIGNPLLKANSSFLWWSHHEVTNYIMFHTINGSY